VQGQLAVDIEAVLAVADADRQVADGEGHIGVVGVDGVGPGDVAGDLHGSGRND
jgi:hypothetical protein